jgi:hypothetical protein
VSRLRLRALTMMTLVAGMTSHVLVMPAISFPSVWAAIGAMPRSGKDVGSPCQGTLPTPLVI